MERKGKMVVVVKLKGEKRKDGIAFSVIVRDEDARGLSFQSYLLLTPQPSRPLCPPCPPGSRYQSSARNTIIAEKLDVAAHGAHRHSVLISLAPARLASRTMSSATEATTHEPSQAQRADSAALSAGAPSTSQATTPSTEISQAVMTHDTPSASGGHGRASPFPPSPALSPSSPRGYSGISSLAGSQQVGGDDELQAETQTLMQMLSMVGSRFLESERRGMLGNLAEVQSDEESDVEWAAQGSLDPTYQTDRNVQSFSSLGRTRLRYGMAGELLDDQGESNIKSIGTHWTAPRVVSLGACPRFCVLFTDHCALGSTATPRGGSTPMTSSLIGAPRPRAPLRRTLLSHSEHLTSKEPGAPLQAPSVCPNEVPASPSDHPDDENAGDDESEQGDGSEGRSLSGSCLSAAVAGSQATSSAAQSRRFPSAPSRAGTPTLLASFTESALAKDQERKRKLAKKLVDIFGLDESEEILAGEQRTPPWANTCALDVVLKLVLNFALCRTSVLDFPLNSAARVSLA